MKATIFKTSQLQDFFYFTGMFGDAREQRVRHNNLSASQNFLFKVREDGGYDCTTEIIAHGEILESLTQKTSMVHVKPTMEDWQKVTGYGKKAEAQSGEAGAEVTGRE